MKKEKKTVQSTSTKEKKKKPFVAPTFDIINVELTDNIIVTSIEKNGLQLGEEGESTYGKFGNLF